MILGFVYRARPAGCASGTVFVLGDPCMKPFEPSSGLAPDGMARPLAPLIPLADWRDLDKRVRNYRRSFHACPAGWQVYFEVLMVVMERQAPE